MKNNFKEIIITLALIVTAVLLLNPFMFWMPDIMLMSMLVVILILFGLFSSFILREHVSDEREGQHRTMAGRNAFLVSSAVLILGIIFEGYHHSVDVWLVLALVSSIVVKLGTRIWTDRNL